MYLRNLRALPFRELAGLCFAEGDPEPVAAAPVEPAAEPAPAPVLEAEAAAEPAAEPAPAAEEPKPAPKSPVAQLQGRVGHLTKVVHGKDARIAELEAQLAAGGVPEPLAEPGSYDDAEVQRRATALAQQIAATTSFNEKATKVWEQGKKDFPDFAERVGILADLGVVGGPNAPLTQAVMAVDDPVKVLHALGADAEEAIRIASLPPVQQGVELAKFAAKVSAKPAAQVSAAPAPIKPLGGVAQPEPDLYNPDLYRGDTVSDDYLALRAKQSPNAPWLSRYQGSKAH